jgi:DNA-directed RNA polymerase subunit RPC12/RpoP
MTTDVAMCAQCQTPIVDPTTRVIHGDMTYCCPNCSEAMEQHGSGSDPDVLQVDGHLRCAHCSVVIVDEATMESRGDQAFCCANCSAAMGTVSQGAGKSSGDALPADDRPRQMR